jgi:hypothetical protein
MELDHGAVLRKETGLDKPEMVQFVIGNPLIMKDLAERLPDAVLRSGHSIGQSAG